MLKLLAIIVFLYGIVNKANATEDAIISREIKLSQPCSHTIANGSHLFTIAANKTHLRVNSTDATFKPCTIAIDPADHFLQREIQTKRVGGKIIVLSVREKSEKDSTTRVNYTILIVDPVLCNYKAVSTLEEVLQPYWPKTDKHLPEVSTDKCTFKHSPTPGEALPRDYFKIDKYLPQILTHDHESFDVFYPSLTTCAPCRYSIDGNRIPLEHQIKPETNQLTLFAHIEVFDSPNLTHGYFYANSFRNGSTIMKLLDRDFSVVKQRFEDYIVDVAAVNTVPSTNISVCYMVTRAFPFHSGILNADGKPANHVFCERFDENLNVQSTTALGLPDQAEPRAMSLSVNSSGVIFVALQLSHLNGNDRFDVYRLDARGALIDDVQYLGEERNDNFVTWNLRGIVDDDRYCLEITRKYSDWSGDGEWVKCVDL